MRQLKQIAVGQVEAVKDAASTAAKPTSPAGGNAPSASDLSPERRRTWALLIMEAKAFLFQPALTGDELEGVIVAFDNQCEDIPTAKLYAVYKRSMRLENLAYWDGRAMLRAWNELQASGLGGTPAPCGFCGGKGVLMVFDPATKQDIEKECPVCRKVVTAVAVRK